MPENPPPKPPKLPDLIVPLWVYGFDMGVSEYLIGARHWGPGLKGMLLLKGSILWDSPCLRKPSSGCQGLLWREKGCGLWWSGRLPMAAHNRRTLGRSVLSPKVQPTYSSPLRLPLLAVPSEEHWRLWPSPDGCWTSNIEPLDCRYGEKASSSGGSVECVRSGALEIFAVYRARSWRFLCCLCVNL